MTAALLVAVRWQSQQLKRLSVILMPDILTASERAAIADAIAAGRINRIPAGVSATAVDYVWDGKSLVQTDGGSKCWRKNRLNFKRQTKPEAAERRDRVCALVLQGWTRSAIAKDIGVSERAVTHHIAALRAAGRLPKIEQFDHLRKLAEAKTKQAEERRRQVLVMWKDGQTWQDIATALGVTFSCVKRDVLILRRQGHRRAA